MMRISGSGIARNGRNAIKRRRELWMAADAISCLHDVLLAVAKGDITPEQAREFFWRGDDLAKAQFIGGVLSFEEKAESLADERDSAEGRAAIEALKVKPDVQEQTIPREEIEKIFNGPNIVEYGESPNLKRKP